MPFGYLFGLPKNYFRKVEFSCKFNCQGAKIIVVHSWTTLLCRCDTDHILNLVCFLWWYFSHLHSKWSIRTTYSTCVYFEGDIFGCPYTCVMYGIMQAVQQVFFRRQDYCILYWSIFFFKFLLWYWIQLFTLPNICIWYQYSYISFLVAHTEKEKCWSKSDMSTVNCFTVTRDTYGSRSGIFGSTYRKYVEAKVTCQQSIVSLLHEIHIGVGVGVTHVTSAHLKLLVYLLGKYFWHPIHMHVTYGIRQCNSFFFPAVRLVHSLRKYYFYFQLWHWILVYTNKYAHLILILKY